MKNIYKLSLMLVAFLAFASCALDDDAPASNNNSVVFVNLDKSGVIITDGTTGETLLVTLSQALQTDTKVEYNLNGSDEVLILEAGNSSFSFNFPTGIGVVNTLKLNSAVGLYNNVQLGDNTDVTFLGLPNANPNGIEALAFNETGRDNFWFGLSSFTSNGTWRTDYHQNFANGYPRPMTIPFNGVGNLEAIPNSTDVEPDYIALNIYTENFISNPTIGITIYLVMPDGSYEVFESSVPNNLFEDNPVVAVKVEDDAANPGMKKYTFSAL